jgi:hypothetical protein
MIIDEIKNDGRMMKGEEILKFYFFNLIFSSSEGSLRGVPPLFANAHSPLKSTKGL